MKQVHIALAMLAGGIFVYCTQQNSGPAGAQTGGGTCCTQPAPAPADLVFDDGLMANCRSASTPVETPPLDVSGHRQVVIHASNCGEIRVRHGYGQAGLVSGTRVTCGTSSDGLVTIDPRLGRELSVAVVAKDCVQPVKLTVAGVK